MAQIRVKNEILYIDFRYKFKRHVLSTKLKNTKANIQLAKLKIKAIEYDIKLNRLDIKKYFPQFIDIESSDKQILSEFFQYYLKEKTLRETSMRSLMWAWDKYINPYFGNYRLNDITRHEVLVFRNHVSEKLSGSTTNLVMTHLAGMLTRAHDEGKLSNYPMKKIGKLDTNTEPIDPFSFDELVKFVKFLNDGKYPEADMIYVWSRCGFRHGEIVALKWEDLDYHNRQLNIRRAMKNNGVEGLPKTKHSIRTLDLRPDVIAAFKRQEKRSRLASDYIFPNPLTKQRYTLPVVFWRRFKNLLNLAELKYRSPNQLRHTFATLHIAAGENISWVSKMLGHRNVTTTLERYNKFIPNLTRDDGSAFEKALENANARLKDGYFLVTP